MAFPAADNPDALLTRTATATALTAAGYPVKPATLATKASRGGGPPYRLFGVRPLYRWGDALTWAQSRLSAPQCSTSEGGVNRVSTNRKKMRADRVTSMARKSIDDNAGDRPSEP